jgi:hypothetical protein
MWVFIPASLKWLCPFPDSYVRVSQTAEFTFSKAPPLVSILSKHPFQNYRSYFNKLIHTGTYFPDDCHIRGNKTEFYFFFWPLLNCLFVEILIKIYKLQRYKLNINLKNHKKNKTDFQKYLLDIVCI